MPSRGTVVLTRVMWLPPESVRSLVMATRTLRGAAAVAGVGETPYYKWGRSPDPEFVLAVKAILAACEDAGIDPRDIDGFASYSGDRNDAPRLATALGIKELRY